MRTALKEGLARQGVKGRSSEPVAMAAPGGPVSAERRLALFGADLGRAGLQSQQGVDPRARPHRPPPAAPIYLLSTPQGAAWSLSRSW